MGLEGFELMPFSRPTLPDLIAQEQSDLAAALPGADPLLPVSNLGILAAIFGETLHAMYGYLDYVAKQSVPFTSVDEAFEGWAALKGVTRKAATAATDHGTWTGTTGLTIPAGTAIVRGDGVAYVTTADATVGGAGTGTVTAPIRAVDPGSAGSLSAGMSLLISNAIAGIASAGVAVGDGTPGTDVEAFEAFRTRVLAIYASPPQGGAASDYVEWALQVPGVTRAWSVPNGLGDGTVVVYTMFDVAEAGHGGFPQGVGGVAAAETRAAAATQDLLTVANYIFDLQPVTALVYALAPQANTVTFTINLPGAGASVKAAIAAAIANVFLVTGAPGGTVNLSEIEAAIAVLPGTAGFVITAEACTHGSLVPGNGNIVSNAGYLPVLGAITWAG
jgi:uncharacterized phage protein gp47/JayE